MSCCVERHVNKRVIFWWFSGFLQHPTCVRSWCNWRSTYVVGKQNKKKLMQVWLTDQTDMNMEGTKEVNGRVHYVQGEEDSTKEKYVRCRVETGVCERHHQYSRPPTRRWRHKIFFLKSVTIMISTIEVKDQIAKQRGMLLISHIKFLLATSISWCRSGSYMYILSPNLPHSLVHTHSPHIHTHAHLHNIYTCFKLHVHTPIFPECVNT